MQALYNKYRPKTLDEVVGQDGAVAMLRSFGKDVPNAVMFAGQSGVGKTTLARVVGRTLGCTEKNLKLQEICCGSVDPLDTVREIKSHAAFKSMLGGKRVWVFDELQAFSRAPTAQTAMLKMIEDAGDADKRQGHNYYFCCTTDPQKVNLAIRNRCTQIGLTAVASNEVVGLVERIAKAESIKLESDVLTAIVAAADGSPRKALVALEAVAKVTGKIERLGVIESYRAAEVAEHLPRALMNSRSTWADVAKILRSLEAGEAESVRCGILGYARAVLLGGGPQAARAAFIVELFRDQIFGSGNASHAILAAAAYAVVKSGAVR